MRNDNRKMKITTMVDQIERSTGKIEGKLRIAIINYRFIVQLESINKLEQLF